MNIPTPTMMLHCGASQVSREQLALAPVPAADGRWVPISHNALLGHVDRSIADAGLIVTHESHALNADEKRYFGLMGIRSADETLRDYEVILGIRNSNDKSFPAALCIGSRVFVCDNLAFSAEVKVARRHTIHILRDLPELVSRVFGQLSQHRVNQDARFDTYKRFELTAQQIQDILVEGVDTKAIRKTDAVDILREWKVPRHREFIEAGNTAWRFLNAFTEISKPSDKRASFGVLEETPTRTIGVQNILDRYCGLALTPAQSATN